MTEIGSKTVHFLMTLFLFVVWSKTIRQPDRKPVQPHRSFASDALYFHMTTAEPMMMT